MHNEGDMKHEASAPATKGDLERFATKADLIEFKDEIRQDIRGFQNRMALDAIELRADIGALGEKLSKLILQTRSDRLGAVESFVFKVEKVERAQILTGDRISLLEGRVTALESPRPQHP